MMHTCLLTAFDRRSFFTRRWAGLLQVGRRISYIFSFRLIVARPIPSMRAASLTFHRLLLSASRIMLRSS